MDRETERRTEMENLVNQYHIGDDEESLVTLLELAYEFGFSAGRNSTLVQTLKTIEEFKHAKS